MTAKVYGVVHALAPVREKKKRGPVGRASDFSEIHLS